MVHSTQHERDTPLKPSPLNWNTLSSTPAGPGPMEVQEGMPTVMLTTTQLAGARWDARNEARPGSARTARPSEQRLKALGYSLYGIGAATVLNALSEREPDEPLSAQPVGEGAFDVVCSGTFIYESRGKDIRVPAGPVVRRGRLDGLGVEKGQRRGAVAILADGTLRIARTGGSRGDCSLPTLQAVFASPNLALSDLCGGGALLIERGARVASQDIAEVQRFESGAGGFGAPQLKCGMHLAVGICDGTAWLVVAHSHSGETIQNDLHGAGFGSLVLFDGGSGGFLRDGSGTPYQGRDVQGFGIKLKA